MDFQSIFGWKSLPEAGFGKNVVIDADRCSGSRIHLDHPNAGRSVVQDHSSDHRFKRLHLTRASVRRASGFVLTGNSEVILQQRLCGGSECSSRCQFWCQLDFNFCASQCRVVPGKNSRKALSVLGFRVVVQKRATPCDDRKND
jgi:hypothetical protein